MEGKKVLEAVKEKRNEIEAKENKKLESQKERDNQKEMFLKCKENCQCKDKCMAAGLKQCPICKNVLKYVCGKAACKLEGKRPTMIELSSVKRKSA